MLLNLDTAIDLQAAIRAAARQRRIALGMTQADLARRSGVPLGSLKRFERLGEVSLASLLSLAEALDALDGFRTLFPLPEARSLDDIERQARLPSRVGRKART